MAFLRNLLYGSLYGKKDPRNPAFGAKEGGSGYISPSGEYVDPDDVKKYGTDRPLQAPKLGQWVLNPALAARQAGMNDEFYMRPITAAQELKIQLKQMNPLAQAAMEVKKALQPDEEDYKDVEGQRGLERQKKLLMPGALAAWRVEHGKDPTPEELAKLMDKVAANASESAVNRGAASTLTGYDKDVATLPVHKLAGERASAALNKGLPALDAEADAGTLELKNRSNKAELASGIPEQTVRVRGQQLQDVESDLGFKNKTRQSRESLTEKDLAADLEDFDLNRGAKQATAGRIKYNAETLDPNITKEPYSVKLKGGRPVLEMNKGVFVPAMQRMAAEMGTNRAQAKPLIQGPGGFSFREPSQNSIRDIVEQPNSNVTPVATKQSPFERRVSAIQNNLSAGPAPAITPSGANAPTNIDLNKIDLLLKALKLKQQQQQDMSSVFYR